MFIGNFKSKADETEKKAEMMRLLNIEVQNSVELTNRYKTLNPNVPLPVPPQEKTITEIESDLNAQRKKLYDALITLKIKPNIANDAIQTYLSGGGGIEDLVILNRSLPAIQKRFKFLTPEAMDANHLSNIFTFVVREYNTTIGFSFGTSGKLSESEKTIMEMKPDKKSILTLQNLILSFKNEALEYSEYNLSATEALKNLKSQLDLIDYIVSKIQYGSLLDKEKSLKLLSDGFASNSLITKNKNLEAINKLENAVREKNTDLALEALDIISTRPTPLFEKEAFDGVSNKEILRNYFNISTPPSSSSSSSSSSLNVEPPSQNITTSNKKNKSKKGIHIDTSEPSVSPEPSKPITQTIGSYKKIEKEVKKEEKTKEKYFGDLTQEEAIKYFSEKQNNINEINDEDTRVYEQTLLNNEIDAYGLYNNYLEEEIERLKNIVSNPRILLLTNYRNMITEVKSGKNNANEIIKKFIVDNHINANNVKYDYIDGDKTKQIVSINEFLTEKRKSTEITKRINKIFNIEKADDIEKIAGKGLKQTVNKNGFRMKRIKIGKGLEKEEEQPRFLTFGKYVINRNQLYNDGRLNFRYPSLGVIPQIKPYNASDNYGDFVKDVLENGKINQRHYTTLNPEEKTHFHRVVEGAGLTSKLNLSRTADLDDKDRERFEVLKGSIMAGNNNPKAIKEVKTLLIKFINNRKIGQREGLEFLEYLENI